MDNNIFWGRGLRSHFANIIYERFVKSNWFTYTNVMEDYLGRALDMSISKYDEYLELKKTFSELRKIILNKYPGSIEEEKNSRSKIFRYIGEDKDPLAYMKMVKVINSVNEYWKFCQDSAGFFPMPWLEYFFKDCKDLLKIKKRKDKGEQILMSDANRGLINIEHLPRLYEFIKNKQVIELDYKPYNEEAMHLVFHPQFLKEYNGRWHLLGHADGREPEWAFNLALDRIVGIIRENYKVPYKHAPKGFYNKYFADLVGVSHTEGHEAKHIRIRAHNLSIFKLRETKLLHHSQHTTIEFGEHEDGTYGEFEVFVEVNNEFIGAVLQMGAGLEVVSPADVRQIFAERINELQQRYKV